MALFCFTGLVHGMVTGSVVFLLCSRQITWSLT
uniref:ARK3 n=1 Tax=Arundo donax TaxID=35708 RepID=A0A0A9BBB0_ARUDO